MQTKNNQKDPSRHCQTCTLKLNSAISYGHLLLNDFLYHKPQMKTEWWWIESDIWNTDTNNCCSTTIHRLLWYTVIMISFTIVLEVHNSHCENTHSMEAHSLFYININISKQTYVQIWGKDKKQQTM